MVYYTTHYYYPHASPSTIYSISIFPRETPHTTHSPTLHLHTISSRPRLVRRAARRASGTNKEATHAPARAHTAHSSRLMTRHPFTPPLWSLSWLSPPALPTTAPTTRDTRCGWGWGGALPALSARRLYFLQHQHFPYISRTYLSSPLCPPLFFMCPLRPPIDSSRRAWMEMYMLARYKT